MGMFDSITNLHTCSSSSHSSRNVRDKSKNASFGKIDDALASFNQMIHMNPLPSTAEFNKLLSALVRLKYYETVISLWKQMEFLGILPDICTIKILTYCFCHLGHVNFGFSLLGKNIKLGFQLSD